VLLVDDDLEAVKTFSSWLRLEGYCIRTATDGEAALAQVPGADAIILDLRMPILDGLEFLRRLRQRSNGVPVAIVTGDYLIDEAVLNEFVRLNAQVVFKPLWVDELLSLTSTLVKQTATA
jgi:CheY-like chemotaxis protein